MIKHFLIISTLLLSINLYSQPEQFSLVQAREYALKNSPLIKNADIDIDIAKKKIWETTAMGLPQLSGALSYNNMIDVPTTLLPDFISPAVYGVLMKEGLIMPGQMPTGEPQYFPAQFGTQHNASWNFQASQLIFNGAYIVGLQASRIFLNISKQSHIKTTYQIIDNVSSSYYLVLIADESVKILESSYNNLLKSLNEMQKMKEVGLIEETDVDQLKITTVNIKNTINNLNRQSEISKRLLKFQMGMPLDKEIELSEKLDDIILTINFNSLINDEFIIENNIDYQLLLTQEKLISLNLKRENTTFMPNVVGFYTYQKSAMRNSFDIFEKDKDWFPSSILGISIEVPLFSSGLRLAKVQQAKLELLKIQNTIEQLSDGLQIEYDVARNSYLTAYESYLASKNNYELSLKIYERWQVKFKEGLASSAELTMQQNQYLTAQSNYYNSIFELLSAKIKIERLLNKE